MRTKSHVSICHTRSVLATCRIRKHFLRNVSPRKISIPSSNKESLMIVDSSKKEKRKTISPKPWWTRKDSISTACREANNKKSLKFEGFFIIHSQDHIPQSTQSRTYLETSPHTSPMDHHPLDLLFPHLLRVPRIYSLPLRDFQH